MKTTVYEYFTQQLISRLYVSRFSLLSLTAEERQTSKASFYLQRQAEIERNIQRRNADRDFEEEKRKQAEQQLKMLHSRKSL